jgi:hypothetical protein
MTADQQKAEREQAMMEGIQQGIGTLMGAFAENEATNAKGKAYGDFLKKHGSQLGFDPGYLDDLLKKKPRELALVGDGILGMNNMGRQVMSNQYLQNQMGGGGGYGSGGGGGGSRAGDYVVGQGWQ